MRSAFLLAALPAAVLGLAACDDQTAQNNQNQPGATSTPSVKVAPSGCSRPLLSLMISRNRLPLPSVLRAIT